MLLDLRVQVGLSEGRFVSFIVAEAPVAIHVNHDVASEFLSKIERHLSDKQDRERVVTIHVEDRHLDHFRDIRRVHR